MLNDTFSRSFDSFISKKDFCDNNRNMLIVCLGSITGSLWLLAEPFSQEGNLLWRHFRNLLCLLCTTWRQLWGRELIDVEAFYTQKLEIYFSIFLILGTVNFKIQKFKGILNSKDSTPKLSSLKTTRHLDLPEFSSPRISTLTPHTQETFSMKTVHNELMLSRFLFAV